MLHHIRVIKDMIFTTPRPSLFIINRFYRYFWDMFTLRFGDVGLGPKMATPIFAQDGDLTDLTEPWQCFTHALYGL